jgi:hypothetical protein
MAESCGGTTMNGAQAELDISQSTDLSSATLVIRGSGIPVLDGRAFSGSVKRQRVEVTAVDDLPGACPATRSFKLTVDFEGNMNFPIPNSFAGIDVRDTVSAGCSRPDATCSTSLFLLGTN